MNRRSFFKSALTAVAGFTILPPATTYSRIWKPCWVSRDVGLRNLIWLVPDGMMFGSVEEAITFNTALNRYFLDRCREQDKYIAGSLYSLLMKRTNEIIYNPLPIGTALMAGMQEPTTTNPHRARADRPLHRGPGEELALRTRADSDRQAGRG